MAAVFVDTAAWIALLNRSDDLHERAMQVMQTLRTQNRRLLTTEFVLLEVADALSAPSVRSRTVAFLGGLRRLPLLETLPFADELHAAGWVLYRNRPDKDWGLTDCISFACMTDHQIAQAFTSDHHFEQAGFSILLPLR